MQYVVQRGDTLFVIAQRFNTTVDAILAANPQITDPDVIFPGQIIIIPPGPTPTPTPPPPPTVRCPLLRLGDRGPAVARLQRLLRNAGFNPGPIDGIFGPRTQDALLDFQRSVKELEVTGVADRDTWEALGAECRPVPGIIRYVVRPGDTLYSIAARFNVTVERILRLNPQITNPNVIFPGQVIRIPTR